MNRSWAGSPCTAISSKSPRSTALSIAGQVRTAAPGAQGIAPLHEPVRGGPQPREREFPTGRPRPADDQMLAEVPQARPGGRPPFTGALRRAVTAGLDSPLVTPLPAQEEIAGARGRAAARSRAEITCTPFSRLR